jgi:hypothetical protein
MVTASAVARAVAGPDERLDSLVVEVGDGIEIRAGTEGLAGPVEIDDRGVSGLDCVPEGVERVDRERVAAVRSVERDRTESVGCSGPNHTDRTVAVSKGLCPSRR